MAFTRRLFFGALGATSGLYGLLTSRAALAGTPALAKTRFDLEEQNDIFAYGVASGDPLQDRAILWTQVNDRGLDTVAVEWQAALDPEFLLPVAEGIFNAVAADDYTVKVDAYLPLPATSYYYRFKAHGCWSMTGRTRTAPERSSELRVAVVSCSSIWSGYFNAYEHLARRNDIDLIVHCGDYAYDVPDPDELRNMPLKEVNKRMPTTLHEQRQRFRYYRQDPHLRAAHQQHPWAIVWDNHDIVTEAPCADAMKAFMEWIPMRTSPCSTPASAVYRSLSFGSLLKVILLDTRHCGRDQLIPGTQDKSILGEEQFAWLKDELKNSAAQWNLVVNQVLFAPFTAFGKVLNHDSWDGYPKDRERLLQFLADEGIKNTILVTGDSHMSFASNLVKDGQDLGVEFLPTSVTRGNLDEAVHAFLAKLVKGTFEAAVKGFNPHIRYFESEKHGYGLVNITTAGVNCEFWYVDHLERTDEASCGRALYAAAGANRFTSENSSPRAVSQRLDRMAPLEVPLYLKGNECGGIGGDMFDGLERLTRDSRLTAITLRSADRLNGIGCAFADGTSWKVGGTGGMEQTLALAAEDAFSAIEIGIVKYQSRLQVGHVRIETREGQVLEGGKRPGGVLRFEAPEGRHIVSFFGRAGTELDKLGPIFAPDFA